jgi:hypothetical protein
MKTCLIALALTAPTLAHADVCTDRAVAHVAGREIVAFCQSCGDAAPGIPMIANGNAIDPAHTYVRIADNRFANVALLVGCPVDAGTAPSLDVSDETRDGVLITASDKPVTLAATTRLTPAVAPSPPPAPTVTSSTHYYTTTIDRVPPFAVWAAAGGLGFGLGVAATLGVLALRRRRAMEPRAARLT